MEHRSRATFAVPTFFAALVAAALGFFAAPAFALVNDDNTLIEGAKLCTRYLPRHERQYGIPVHLLAAIASTESGRYHRALGMNLPWPWTINVEGQGYFFDTKKEAIDAVKAFQGRGFMSIDVGCMQVNLHHHPDAFATLEQAFDPAYNVSYAAQFLKRNFEEEGSWRKATADYHSHTPTYGDQYARLVFGAWSRIINKVADARAGRPILNANASSRTAIRYHDKEAAMAAAEIMRNHSRRGTPRTHTASFHAPHMHQISVASDTTRERGVLVIRPQHDSEPVIDQAKLDEDLVTQTARSAQSAQNDATQAMAGPSASGTTAPEAKGPRIVRLDGNRVVGAKGQFDPQPGVTRVNATAAPAPSGDHAHNVFVFDN